MAGTLNLTNTSFEGVRNNIIAFLSNQDEFSDYNFEGSNLGVLIDTLAYNTYYTNYYLNSTFSELFLDTSVRRNSVISKAKELGYFPHSKTGSKATVTLTRTVSTTDPSTLPTSLTYPRYTILLEATVNETAYVFVNSEDVLMPLTDRANGTYEATGVEIRQGIPYTDRYNATENRQEKYTLSNINVDASSVQVVGDGDTYTRIQTSDDIVNITPESAIFWIAEDTNGTHSVYFGDGVQIQEDGSTISHTIGRRPAVNSRIDVSYLVVAANPKGADGANSFSVVNSPSDEYTSTGFNATTTDSAAGATDQESMDSIKKTAPLVYSAQNRAVTKDDYTGLFKQRWPQYASVSVWGGEENDPPRYGAVYIAVISPGGKTLTSTVKRNIENEIRRLYSIAGITPVLIEGEKTFIDVDGEITYSSSKAGVNVVGIQQGATDVIRAYNTNSLEAFNETFKYSEIVNLIKASNANIDAIRLDITLKKTIQPETGTSNAFTLLYDNEIRTGSVSSTTFTYDGFSSCYFVDVDGSINVAKQVDGEAEVVESGVGTINYTTGTIALSDLTIEAYNDSIGISCIPKRNYGNVVSRQSRILTVDNIKLSVVPS